MFHSCYNTGMLFLVDKIKLFRKVKLNWTLIDPIMLIKTQIRNKNNLEKNQINWEVKMEKACKSYSGIVLNTQLQIGKQLH